MSVLWFILGCILGWICGTCLVIISATMWVRGMIYDDNTFTFDGTKYQMVPKE